MSLVSFPNKIPSKQKFYLEENNQILESPFTRKKTIYALPGARWIARFTYDVIDDNDYEDIMNFIYKCRGQLNTFEVGDFLRKEVTTSFNFSRFVTTSSLALNNLQNLSSYFTLNNRLKKVVGHSRQDYVDSNDYFQDRYVKHSQVSYTEDLIQFEPPNIGTTIGTTIGYIYPSHLNFGGKGTFRLVDNKQGNNFTFDGNVGFGYLLCEEVV